MFTQGSSLFGQTQPSTSTGTGLFGGNTTSQTTGTNLFGGNTNTSSIFSQPQQQQTSIFNQQQQQTQQQTSIFGQPQQQQQTNIFGQPQQQQQTSIFSQPQQQQQTGIFGQPQQQPQQQNQPQFQQNIPQQPNFNHDFRYILTPNLNLSSNNTVKSIPIGSLSDQVIDAFKNVHKEIKDKEEAIKIINEKGPILQKNLEETGKVLNEVEKVDKVFTDKTMEYKNNIERLTKEFEFYRNINDIVNEQIKKLEVEDVRFKVLETLDPFVIKVMREFYAQAKEFKYITEEIERSIKYNNEHKDDKGINYFTQNFLSLISELMLQFEGLSERVQICFQLMEEVDRTSIRFLNLRGINYEEIQRRCNDIRENYN